MSNYETKLTKKIKKIDRKQQGNPGRRLACLGDEEFTKSMYRKQRIDNKKKKVTQVVGWGVFTIKFLEFP